MSTDAREWEERYRKYEVSLLNLPIDYSVDFEVPGETARQAR